MQWKEKMPKQSVAGKVEFVLFVNAPVKANSMLILQHLVLKSLLAPERGKRGNQVEKTLTPLTPKGRRTAKQQKKTKPRPQTP